MSPVFLAREAKSVGLMLGRQLGEGAAGKVYALPDMQGFAAKIYHSEAECRKHEAKIELMLANPPELPALAHDNHSYPQIAWPEAKLYDRAGKFIGFVMPEIDFARSTSLVNLLQKSSRRAEKISDYYGYRVLVARNLAAVFAELHRAGHHMIDMKPANLRFYPAVSWMAVVDTDGFSIAGADRRVPAEQVSDEYIAPESWQKRPAELGVEQDLFALAVIIFQLLDNGVHPFAGSPKTGTTQATDLQARIQNGLYPYGLEPHPEIGPSTASVHRMFKRTTRALFDRAFVPGGARPDAAEWRDHLDALVDGLTPCAVKPHEHAHFGAGCGFCGHDARVEAAARQAPARPRARPAVRRPIAKTGASRVPPPTMRGGGLAVGRIRPRRGLALPKPAFQWWHGWPLLLLFALLALTSDELWRRVSPVADAGLRAAGLMTVMTAPAQPVVNAFAEPRDYLIRPAGDALTVDLRRGPGENYPVLDQLSLRTPMIGRGETRGADGADWIWVVRSDDGMAGYVPAAALKPAGRAAHVEPLARGCAGSDLAGQDEGCNDPADAPPALTRRYRTALARALGYDRVFLMEQHQLWLEQRADCALHEYPAQCVQDTDRRQFDELRAGPAVANGVDAVPPARSAHPGL
jgi:hypothetical protein